MNNIPNPNPNPFSRPPLKLTPLQQSFLEGLQDFLAGPESVLILRGPAGTGKTTLVREMCAWLAEKKVPVMLMAPTGRAARILQQRTGRSASTIHRFVYQHQACKQFAVENQENTETYQMVFQIRTNTDSPYTVYLVDEASMVSDTLQDDEFFRHGSGRLLRDLIQYVNPDHSDHHRKLIFVGDPCQLPPVGSAVSPAMREQYLQEEHGLSCRVHELTEVLRQNADSGILKHAWTLRDAIETRNFSRLDLHPLPPDVEQVEMDQVLRTCGDRDMVIGYSNARVQDMNRMMREHRNGNPPHPLPGERMVCVRNQYRFQHPLMNGDLAEVVRASAEVSTRVVPLNKPVNGVKKIVPVTLRFRTLSLRWQTDTGEWVEQEMMINENLLWSKAPCPDSDECKALYVDFLLRHKDLKPGTETFAEALKNDIWFNCAHLKFGYAVTCHKAQGGEWDRVFVDFDSRRNLNMDTFRWIYTAVTRARKTLGLLHPPRVTALTPKVPLDPPPAAMAVQAGLLDRVQGLLQEEGVEALECKEQQFAYAISLRKGEETAALRIIFNGKGIITRLMAQRTPPSALDQRMLEKLSGLLHQPIHPPGETAVRIVGTPCPAQAEFLDLLQRKLEGTPYTWMGAKVYTPFHIQFSLAAEGISQSFDAWHNQEGRLKKVFPASGPVPPCAWSYECLQEILEGSAP